MFRARAITPSVLFIAITCGCNSKAPQPPAAQPPAAQPMTYFDVINNNSVALVAPFAPKNTVLFFLKTDCPIGNRYVPKIKQLAEEFAQDGQAGRFDFQMVYPDCKQDAIEKHQSEYGLDFPTFTDHDHVLVDAIGITRAPEVAVFDAAGTRVYRGRIDDQHVDFGTARPAATSDDLRDTLQSLLGGQTLTPRETQAIGCYIE